MLGFKTTGNATAILYDTLPILVTDPWLTGNAYFGSWTLPFEIPKDILEEIKQVQYVWVSHGHPDHLSSESLQLLTGKTFLLADHIGSRIRDGFIKKGFKVQILPEREWVQLSPHVKVMALADYFQDSILLMDINGRLIVNLNDAGPRGTTQTLKRIIKSYPTSILLKLFGYGDVDMMNCFNEDGSFIKPQVAYNKEQKVIGPQVKFWAEFYGVTHVVPFSCFHVYQREDSLWANDLVTPIETFYQGFDSQKIKLLPYFINYNCENDSYESIHCEKKIIIPKKSIEFGDSWAEELTKEDKEKITKYFRSIEALRKNLDFIELKVGTGVHTVKLNDKPVKGLRFEVPRKSLMTCVEFEIFDDLLIGNYMKTYFIGKWGRKNLDGFTPYVGKFADNGLAKSEAELELYFKEYARKAELEYLFHQVAQTSENAFRSFFDNQSQVFKVSKRIFSYFT